MKLKNILLVVKDIEKSKQFYHDLFGLDMILDNDGNIILTDTIRNEERTNIIPIPSARPRTAATG